MTGPNGEQWTMVEWLEWWAGIVDSPTLSNKREQDKRCDQIADQLWEESRR